MQGAPLSVLAGPPDNDALFEQAMAAVKAVPRDATPEPVADQVAPEPAAVPPAQEAQGAQTPEAGQTGQAPEAVAPPPAPEAKTERMAPALLRIMERESALHAREQKLKEAEAELTAIKSQVESIDTAQRRFKYDPVSYIRSIAPDIDLADLAKQLWYEKLGDVAPPDYRATKEARAAKGSIDELRQEFEAREKAFREEIEREKAEAAYHQYVGAIGTFAKTVPDEYPLVKSFAKSSPDRVQQGLLKIAQRHAQANNGAVLTPAECAAKLNSELEVLRSALGVPTPAAVPTPAPTKAAAPVSTIRNKHTSVQPNRALPSPDDEEAKLEAAMAAVRAVAAGKAVP